MTMTRGVSSEGDEETWKMLASSRPTDEIENRLTSLASRLVEDGGPLEFWESLRTELENKGFRYSSSSLGKLTSGVAASTDTNKPAALESEEGRHHLQAVAALLQISQDRAVQVTMEAVKDMDCDGSHFKALLGTRGLLWKTLHHEQKQRLARLGVVAESLRLEQDPDAPHGRHVKAFLDSLDGLYHDDDARPRGLFRHLLTMACAPTVLVTRDQLQPARALRTDSPTNIPLEREWNSFCGLMAEELRMQQMRERTEALEALLVLLYARIHEGVHRVDYAALLLAFASQDFYASASGPKDLVLRLTQLTGLICAECMALWRTLDASSVWTFRHPLLVGLSDGGDTQIARGEIETIRGILSEPIQESLSTGGIGNPQALGMLAFGLLLQRAHQVVLKSSNSAGGDQSVFATFNGSAMELVQIANDRCGAFDFLYSIVDDLTGTPYTEQRSVVHDTLYDWQFSDKKHGLLLEDSTKSHYTSSDATAYTSIAREVLAASIAAYQDSILDIDRANSFENIGMLCSLGAKIFHNNPLLCQQFWADWEVYSNDSTTIYPMCTLLDAAYQMTTTALRAIDENRISQETFVRAVAPFFHLLSSLSHTSEMVEIIIATFPSGLLRRALLCCLLPQSSLRHPSPEFRESRLSLLKATGRLAQIGNSKSCLVLLRASLEESANVSDGPRVLSRLITGDQDDEETLDSVLTIMAHLLDGAPQQWAMLLAREIIDPHESQRMSLARCFASGDGTVHAASLVLAELVEHLTAVVFSETVNNNDTIAFLHCLESTVLAGAGALATSFSTTSTDSGCSFGTVQNILQALSNFLKILRTVIQLHSCPEVRTTGLQVRDSIIETLGTSTAIGEAIIYYATAPVSLTLASKLQEVIEDQSLLFQVSVNEAHDPDDARKYGAWQGYLAQTHRGKPLEYRAAHYVVEALAKLTSDDIDLEGVSARGCTGTQHSTALLDAAFSSIQLLSQWVSHVDDIVSTHVDDLRSEPRPLSGKAREIVENFSPSRLLSSLAAVPAPCRQSSTMVSSWDSAGLSNVELLLPYLCGATEREARYLGFPSSTLLDLLNSCIGHIWYTAPRDMVADSLFFRALYRSSRFSTAIASSIERAISLSESEQKHDNGEKSIYLDGILSLRVLASCVSSNPSIAHEALYPAGNAIITKLVTLASSVKTFDLSSGHALFSKETEITKLRLATGSLAVLSELWRSIRGNRHQTDSKTAKLSSAIDECGSFITELTLIVSSFARSRDLEDRLDPSDSADYAYGALITYMAFALQVLASEAAHLSSIESASHSALLDLLLRDFLPSGRFVDFSGYRRLSCIHTELENLGYSDAIHPLRVLACFPSTSSTYLTEDFFSMGNAFDVSAASFFLDQHRAIAGNSDEVLLKCSTSYQLANANLMIMEAWKGFSERIVLFPSQLTNGGASDQRLFELIDDTVTALEANLVAIDEAQDEGRAILSSTAKRMASIMGELLLFFLDLGTRNCESLRSIPCDPRIVILEKLATITELALLATSSPRKAEEVDYASLTLGTTVSACAVVALKIVDQGEFGHTENSRCNEVFQSFCRTCCKVLPIARQSLLSDPQNNDSHRSLLCCVSLLTRIFARLPVANDDDAIYLNSASLILVQLNTVGEVLAQGISSAVVASNLISKAGCVTPDAHMHLATLQGILDFLFAIAEKGGSDLLSSLSEPRFVQLLVRNPLFAVQFSEKDVYRPRGYLISDSNLSPATSTFKVGEDDPLHSIWRTSMRILTSSASSSHRDGASVFSEVICEFLEVYQNELVFVLESCASRLTRNGLKESNDILGMIAQMCRRHNRIHFQQRLGSLCYRYVSMANFVLAVLSKVLCASGTARELFHDIERQAADSENFGAGKGSMIRIRHPLMADGIPSAKHEAIKFAHYASKCRQTVSARDFQDSSQTANRFKLALTGSGSETDLERSSRLAVTNSFAAQMEQQVAACIGEALSIVWRMHPVSFSFRSLSEVETTRIDLMALVPMGSIIGFLPFEGPVEFGCQAEDVFSTLSFGRVVSIDTFKRTWIVSPVSASVDPTTSPVKTWTVRAGQLACFEDLTFRKSITTYFPAPDSMSDLESAGNKLSLGSLILIERWCHQESLFLDNAESGAIALSRRLAEQACALLAAELSLHHENGEWHRATSDLKCKLDAQIFELFAEIDVDDSVQRVETPSPSFQHGRLKGVISASAWKAVRPQVVDEVQRCWKDRQDKERRGTEKRSLGSQFWYSGVNVSAARGSFQKSAFRASR